MHEIKDRIGSDKLVRAIEMTDGKVIKDVIGFGSVKDLTDLIIRRCIEVIIISSHYNNTMTRL